MRFKLEQRTNPQHPDAPAKWYAVAVQGEKVRTEELARDISERSTISPADTEGVLEALATLLPEHLLRSEPLHLRGVGTFRIGIRSEGVENPGDFSRSHILGSHIIYTPDVRILSALKDMHYENSGELGCESLAITWLVDVVSGTSNDILTPGGTVRLSGQKMRIEGDSPSVGLRLIQVETQAVYDVPMTAIPVNRLKEIVFAVPPDLPAGIYHVRIVTQYSNSVRFLKTPRSFTYEPLLRVV